MNKPSKKITYVFLQGRKKRLDSEKSISKEFFYSYFFAKDNFENVKIVEMENYERKPIQFFLRKCDTLFNKLTKLPIYTYAIFKKKNLEAFNDSDYILLSTDRVAFSCFPLIWLAKRRNKNLNISFFVMGLFANFPKYKIQKVLRNLFINLMFKKVNKIFFLGKTEYQFATKNYYNFNDKFVFLPFSIDTDFWKSQTSIQFSEKKNILFIGNDGNRDYEFVVKLAKELSQFNFIFITEKIKKESVPKNVKLIRGSWGMEQLTDEEIRNYYEYSKITIIPIKNTNQPSGQSVALQSMSMNTPVIISNIDGFWDKESFIDNEHLLFISENNIKIWSEKITDLYFNEKKYESIRKKGQKLILEKYNISSFDKKVFNSLGLINE